MKKIHPLSANPEGNSTPQHPWRTCKPGYHWVSEHLRERKSGKIEDVDAHCRINPSHKDSIYKDELVKISAEKFNEFPKNISRNSLDFDHGSDFDKIIEGWTEYWNLVFNDSEKCDPNLIKALIATESSFNLKPKSNAIGLMQLMPETLKILGDAQGELKDHLIHLTKEEALDPNANISAGIRWLFWKKRLASLKLKRDATWFEAVENYKSYLNDLILGKIEYPRSMKDLKSHYEKLTRKTKPL